MRDVELGFGHPENTQAKEGYITARRIARVCNGRPSFEFQANKKIYIPYVWIDYDDQRPREGVRRQKGGVY